MPRTKPRYGAIFWTLIFLLSWPTFLNAVQVSVSYTYDSLNRLTYATYTQGANATLTYIYDPLGNITNYSSSVVDTNPPLPNPMTWATSPYGASSTSMSMVATTAADSTSPPVCYYFDFVDSPTGGTGGADSSCQSLTSYTNTGLQADHQYGYSVKAMDSASPPNGTSPSSPPVYKYTLANTPGVASFSNVTQTCIRANWTANGNRSGTEFFCENTTHGTNSDLTTNLYWDSCGLTCNTTYSFQVKARNGDSIETDWTSLGNQSTLACPDSIAPVISITSHTDGQHVSTSSITLAGTATDAGNGDNGIQQVTVNGIRADNDIATGDGIANWSKGVSLSSGPNPITVIAFDNSSNHNQTPQDITIYYDVLDTTPPSLSITSHNDGQHVSTPSITLAGTASDSGEGDNGIQQVTVNGVRANNDTAIGSGPANWEKLVTLNLGVNTINVIAYDDSPNHNQTSQTITIYYDLFTIYVSKDGSCNGNNPCFPNIQNGIAFASISATIKITEETYIEDILLDFSQEIILQGGWDTNFTSNPSSTIIQGSITITNGTMILENIILK